MDEKLLESVRAKLTEKKIDKPTDDDILTALGEIDSDKKITDEFIGDDEKLGAFLDDLLTSFNKPKQ